MPDGAMQKFSRICVLVSYKFVKMTFFTRLWVRLTLKCSDVHIVDDEYRAWRHYLRYPM